MARFSTIRHTRLAETVVHHLIRSLMDGDLAPGQELPAESALVSEFGVSRTVIRDALQSLADKGMVNVQQGRRTVVLDRADWNILDPEVIAAELEGAEGDRLLDEIIRTRLLWECEMAEQAASRITGEQLLAMGALLERMRGLVATPDEYLDADIAFHELIMAASGSRIARAIMRSLHEPLRLARRVTNQVPGSLPRAQAYHEDIYRQLARHDPDGAREAMREHLTWTLAAWQTMMAHDPLRRDQQRLGASPGEPVQPLPT